MSALLLDTGSLVAFLAAETLHAAWAVQPGKPPMPTCEPLLTEAAPILKREGVDPDAIFTLLGRKVVRVALQLETERADLRALMRRYRDRPRLLADACLVRLAELHSGAKAFTLDSDFRIYRRHGNKVIPLPMPDNNAQR